MGQCTNALGGHTGTFSSSPKHSSPFRSFPHSSKLQLCLTHGSSQTARSFHYFTHWWYEYACTLFIRNTFIFPQSTFLACHLLHSCSFGQFNSDAIGMKLSFVCTGAAAHSSPVFLLLWNTLGYNYFCYLHIITTFGVSLSHIYTTREQAGLILFSPNLENWPK